MFLRNITRVLFSWALSMGSAAYADSISDNPILFVTVVPNPSDFATFAATFGNHRGALDSIARGGDLYIRYPNGTLKNLTQAAGLGNSGFQGAQSIAVRDPLVHWDGQKALFSMVIGSPTQQYQVSTYNWQIYEITGLAQSDTPVITKVQNQPSSYNNVTPLYTVDDKILFTSDKPRDDSVSHAYPQKDEYESTATNTGIWKLNPANGETILLDHAPSGDFTPTIDSFGRVIFTRWDHLQRDQQNVGVDFGAFNYASEESSQSIGSAPEVFPEARSLLDPDYKSNMELQRMNQFFPWMMNQDGTDLETLNHFGRQESLVYIERSFKDDSNIVAFGQNYTTGSNQNPFEIMLHIKESPTEAGRYYGTRAPEFGTHAGGQIISLTGAPGVNANDMQATYHTHPDTAGSVTDNETPPAGHTGLYRDPLPLTNGKIISAHTSTAFQDRNTGSTANPVSYYNYRLKLLKSDGTYLIPDTNVTSGISKSISYWNPDQMVSYNGNLWELMPVEVRSRTRPANTTANVPSIEQGVVGQAGITLEELKAYLKAANLALIVGRNLTSRDKNDRQQPTNIRVTGTDTQAIPKSGKIYDISHFQIFQGDLIRGYTGRGPGRRVLAQAMHSVPDGVNIKKDGGPVGSVEIADDGSVAAFVPAGRALSWQMTDSEGNAVVRERYWLTFQAGEVRVCGSCHGVNKQDQLGNGEPQNAPLALSRVLANFRNLPLPTPKPGEGDKIKLQVEGLPSIKSGGKFKLTVNGGSASDSLSLSAEIKKTACSGTFNLKTGSKKRTLKGKFPKTKGKLKLMVRYQGSSADIATKKVSLNSVGKAKAGTEKACSALFKSLKNQ